MTRSGRLLLSIAWLSAIPALSPSQDLSREPISLVAPGAPPAIEGATEQESLEELRAIAGAAGARILPEGALDEEKAPVVLLCGASVKEVSGWSDEKIQAIAAAVRRGAGLVAVGDAAAALPGSSGFSSLLGRRIPGAGFEEIPEGRGLPLAVLDQEHPITQCLTHWVLRRGRPTAEGDPRSTALIALGPRSAGVRGGSVEGGLRPVLWLRKEGAGRVVVLAVQEPPRGDRREGALLSALAARCVEFASGREIRVALPGSLPLLASALERQDAGDLSLLPPLKGFYRGRQIAPVMGYGGASWLVRPEREGTEEPEKVLDSLEIREGSTVADLGAGVGYFTFRMARRVGPRGKVLAADIQAEMVRAIQARSREEGAGNVEAILSGEKDPNLPAGSVDLVLMVDVYHELSDPEPVMAAVGKALSGGDGEVPRGRLALVEYRGEDPTVPIRALHRMTHEQVRSELEGLGFRWLETKEFLRHQRVIVFERKGR